MLVAIAHVLMDDFRDFLIFEDVILERGGDVHQRHAGLDPVLEVDVFVQVLRGPEIDQLDGAIHTANTVNAPEALDDANGIPVNVVIDKIIAVLEILPLRYAISGDKAAVINKGSNLLLDCWLDGIVPFTVKYVTVQVDALHLQIGNSSPNRILSTI